MKKRRFSWFSSWISARMDQTDQAQTVDSPSLSHFLMWMDVSLMLMTSDEWARIVWRSSQQRESHEERNFYGSKQQSDVCCLGFFLFMFRNKASRRQFWLPADVIHLSILNDTFFRTSVLCLLTQDDLKCQVIESNTGGGLDVDVSISRGAAAANPSSVKNIKQNSQLVEGVSYFWVISLTFEKCESKL